MPPKIQPNVNYRIQNVDFGNFLERRNGTDLIMRPMKQISEQQVKKLLFRLYVSPRGLTDAQWFFREDNTNGTFQILDVDDRDYLLNAVNPKASDPLDISIEQTWKALGSRWKLPDVSSKEF